MRSNTYGKPPAPPRAKRYGWWRCYEGFPYHPKWRVVARMAGVPIPTVLAVAAALLDEASRARPKGRVENFKPFECGEALGITPDDVARVFAVLEGPEIGWLDQDYIVDWHDRQPDSEDPTANERQRRKRARTDAALKGLPDPYPPMSRVTPVTHGDVTLEKRRIVTTSECGAARAQQAPRLSGLDSGSSGEKFQDEQQARTWLLGTGKTETGLGARVVADALGMRLALTADQVIRRWNNELEDPVTLANIIREADAQALNGEAFENIVRQQIARHIAERTNGPSLPLPLTGLKKNG